MLNKNDVVMLEITALTNEGSGVGHYGADENSRGMAVFRLRRWGTLSPAG